MTDRATVLVVEDDAALRELVTTLLEGEGYEVLQAESGWEALHLARESAPALVVADQGLPGMSGLELLERLRAADSTRHIPIVLVSGSEPDRAGPKADAVIPKPFDLDALLTYVDRATTARLALS